MSRPSPLTLAKNLKRVALTHYAFHGRSISGAMCVLRRRAPPCAS